LANELTTVKNGLSTVLCLPFSVYYKFYHDCALVKNCGKFCLSSWWR